jgi:PAS domain S-box-containing protein
MSIYKRTIILICGIFLVLMLLVYVISNVIYRQGFEDLERKTVENNVTQVTEALSVNLDALDAMCYNWAEWDDTYIFAQEYNQDYVDRNLQDDTFTSAKISLVSIFNTSQGMVYGKAYDIINEEEIILPDDFIKTAITDGLATSAVIGNTVAGVMLLNGQPMLVVSQPILTSWGEGPIAGALIFGRFIDAEVISYLAETTHLSVSLLPIPTDDSDLETNRIMESLNESGPTLIQAQNSDTIAGYTYVNDLRGNPAFIFEVDIPRDIFHQGTKAIALLHLLLMFIGIVFCIAFILLIKKLILSRLMTLSESVSKIGASTDITRRVTMSGNDELSRLATNINEMLTSLENANKAARESEELLKENNEQLDTVLNSVPCGILVIDAETHIIQDANIYASNMIGAPMEEIIGKECHQFICPAERGKCPITDLGKDIDHSERTLINIRGNSIPILKNIVRITIGKNQYLLETFIDITEQKRMEAALADEATRRRILVEQSRDGIVILDQNGTVYEANRRFAEMLGYSLEEVLKLKVWDWEFLYPPEQVREMLRTVDEAGDQFITRHRRKDGTTYDVEISTNGAMFAGRKLIFCVCRDITERKEAEEKRQAILQTALDGFWICDLNGKFIEVNDSYCTMTGYTREELLKMSIIDVEAIENTEDTSQRINKIIQHGGDRFETKHRCKDGRIIDIEISVTYDNIGEGQLTVFVRDITKRKKDEQALKESEAKFSAAFRSSPNMMAIIRAKDGKFIEVNESYARFTGYTKEEIIGHKSIELGLWVNKGDRARMLELLEKNGQVDSEEYLFRIKNGEIRTWLFSGERLTLGNEQCIIAMTVDITERKRMEKLQNDEIHILMQMGQGVELSELLDSIVRLGESHNPVIKGSVMLYDAQKNFLLPVAMPSLPASYRKLMKNGVPIGPNMGACGTAAHLKKRVIVPRVKDYTLFPKEVADQVAAHGLLACWSQPIIGTNGDLLGTIANYSSETGNPSDSDIRVLEWSAHIAAIAIERRQAEVALHESEEKFSLAFHSSPNTMAITTAREGRFIEINDSHTRFTGYSREETIGRTALELGLWSKAEDRIRMLNILKNRGRVDNEEFLFRMKSGEMRNWLFSAEHIVIGGEPCLISITTDITEQRLMERALRVSEEKFSLAFHSSPATIAITKLQDGKYIEVNDSLVNTIGYTSQELIGRTAAELNIWVRPEDRARLFQIMKVKGKVSNEEFNFRTKSGEIRTWLFSAHGIDIAGEPCMIGVSVDITDRKQAEAALKDSEEKLQRMFDSVIDAITVINLNGVIIECNEKAPKLMGFSTKDEILGKNSLEMIVPRERERGQISIQKVLEEGAMENIEFTLLKANGSEFSAEISGSALKDINGITNRIIIISRDITERKQAEKELKEAMANLEQSSSQLAATNKELEAFSYSVSHDLRSPLRSIDGFSQALLEDYEKKLDKTGLDYLRRLRTASQKMGELIDGILKLSRLTRSEMSHVPIDLSSLAEETANRLQEMQPKRQVKFAIAKDLTANGDPQLLRVLLENLLGNAWKFTSKKSQAKIEFNVEKNNGEKTFFVKDDGAGFDMTYADRLFGAFQRLHETEEFPGTGIGLATVHRIINRHGGTIWAEGAVGKGATFYFTIG